MALAVGVALGWGGWHPLGGTYDGGDGEFLLPCVVEQLEYVVADNDTRLAAENVRGTHSELVGMRSDGEKMGEGRLVRQLAAVRGCGVDEAETVE